MRHPATGWIGLAAYILAWDTVAPHYGHPTLSRAFWTALHHPTHRIPTLAATAWTLSHLLLQRPKRILYWI